MLRELPIRNFYARGLLMTAFFAKMFDQYGWGLLLPHGYGARAVPSYVTDIWDAARDVEVFNLSKDAVSSVRIPTVNNQLPASLQWASNQPGHMDTTKQITTKNLPSKLGAFWQTAEWDGTFNQPLNGLCHPMHKDSAAINWY